MIDKGFLFKKYGNYEYKLLIYEYHTEFGAKYTDKAFFTGVWQVEIENNKPAKLYAEVGKKRLWPLSIKKWWIDENQFILVKIYTNKSNTRRS